ncbi:MAG: autotransporter-associated beta strand repeat-containing protein, partial [Cyclobacteriaceae bacterium]|nr:autotransporter-associated beta strand repeat-containing protein [Cyclobacteriaceae bacterium]
MAVFFGFLSELNAQTRFSVASGDWNDPAVWSATSGGAGGASPPVAGNAVQLERGFTVTVNTATAACASVQLGGTVTGTGAGTLVFNAGSQLTVSGAVMLGNTGSTFRFGTINMTAGGTLICQSISSNSTTDVFTEGTGTLQLTANNTLPTNDTGNQFGAFNNLTINGGTTTLGKSISIAGTLNVNAGVFALGANNVTSVGAVSMNGTSITGSGILTLAGNVTNIAGGTQATISAPIALGGATRTFNVNDGAAVPDLLLSGIVSGTGGILKAGAGSMNLAAVNTYSGSTTVSTGILRIASTGGAIPDGSALTIAAGSTFDLNGNDEAVGSIAGAGTITSSASGSMTLTTGGDNNNTVFSGIIQNGSATLVSLVKNGSGTLTLSGANTFTGGTLLNAGGININNANALGAATGAFTIAGGTINNTTGGPLTLANYPQAWNGDFTFGGTQSLNLGTGPVTLTGNRQVTVSANTLTVGGIVSGSFNLTKAGAGTLNLGTNAVTLNSLIINAGTVTSTTGTLSIAADLTVAGTFNHNNGTVHYNGTSTQSVAQVTYNNLMLSGTGQKNATGNVTCANLDNAAVLDMGANTLSVSGATTNTGTIRFSGASNGLAISSGTIEYYGASQNITAGTYNNLTINQSGGEALLAGNVTVNGTLTLASRNLNLNGYTLTLGSGAVAVAGGPFSSSKMIIATGGSEVRKVFAGVGSYTFPIGDNTGMLEYSPITVNVNAGTFGTPYVGVSVVDSKHPNNASVTHFLSRYWNVTNSGITNASITASYVAADISGTEASGSAAQLDGTFSQTSNGWIKYSALAGNTLTAANAPLTSGQASAFTGITGANPAVSILGGGGTICIGGSVGLTASVVGGDPSILYTWTPAAGLSATTVSNPSATPTVTTAYSVSIRDGNGILATSPSSTITVDQSPTVAAAGTDQIFCGTSVTLAANVPVTGTGVWSFAPGGNPDALPLTAFSNTALPNSTFTGTTGQVYTLRWTISNGLCAPSSDDVQITFLSTPSVADAGPASIDQCNTSTFTMSATAPVVGTGTWTVQSGTATITNPSLATTTVTGIAAGTSATLRWTVGNGTCPSTFDDIVLTNAALAPVANAGPDQTQCNTATFTLAGNAAAPGTGTWVIQSGPGVVTTPGSPTSTVTGVTAGGAPTVVRWTISNGVCASTFDDVVLINNATPSVADAGPASIHQCITSTFVMNATVPVVGSGVWTVQSGTATITNPSLATTTVTGIAAGSSATLRWTVGNGTCPSTFDDIVLTNVALAPVANAGPDQTQCNTATFTLAGNAAAPGTGTWVIQSGPGVVTTPGSPTSTVTGVTAGGAPTVVRWTISNGVCASTFDEVVLINNATPSVADAGPASIDQCNTSTFVMNATAPVVGSGTWSVQSGIATITNPTSPSTTITGITAGTSATLRWTVGNGTCPTTFDDIVLTNAALAPVANAGADQTQCNTSTFTLAGNAAAPGTGLWVIQSGPGVVTTPGSPTSTVTGVTAGGAPTVVRWTISNGVCASTFDDVVLINNATPSIADAGPASIDQCNTSTFVMNATAPVVGTGTWTVQSGTATITNPSLATTTVTGIAAGTSATLRWTVGNGTCPSTFDDIVLTNAALAPVANAGPDQTQCNTATFTLAGNAAAPGTGTWVIQSGPGVVTTPGSPTSTVTGVTAGGAPTVVRWTISNGVCSTFDDVVLINNVDPFVTTPSNQVLCAGSATTAITFSGNASQYSWTNDKPSIGLPASGIGNIDSFTALNATGSPVLATITISPISGPCIGTQQSFTITVNPVPVINPIANVATGTGVVVGPIALTTSALGGENFTWSGGAAVGLPDGSGPASIPAFTTTNPGITPLSAVVSVFAAKDGCTGPTRDFNITVYPVPGALAGDQNICSGSFSSVLITATVVGTTFSWDIGTVTGSVSGQSPGSGPVIAQQLTSVAGGVVEYVITPTAFGIEGPTTSVFVSVLPTPVGNGVSAGTHAICSGSSLNIAPSASVLGTTFTWTGSNGSGGIGNITDTPVNATNSPVDITYTVIPTGPAPTFCVGAPFTIVVTVNPNPGFTATNNAAAICSGASASILFNSSTTGH